MGGAKKMKFPMVLQEFTCDTRSAPPEEYWIDDI
jgi:hypothetical protein